MTQTTLADARRQALEAKPAAPKADSLNGKGQDALAALGALIDSRLDARLSGDWAPADVMNRLEALGEATSDLFARIADIRRPLEITLPEAPEAKTLIDSPHPMLESALRLARPLRQIWLIGPAGSGKSTLAGQMAEALQLALCSYSFSEGMSEGKLIGRKGIDGSYLAAPFVQAYEGSGPYANGALLLLDEIDAADANCSAVLHSALANGHLAVPDREAAPLAMRHPKTVIVCAGNTSGDGASHAYTARTRMDAAFRDRFTLGRLQIDYDKTLERSILADAELCTALWTIRDNVTKHRIEKIVSTRAFADSAKLLAAGFDRAMCIGQLTLGWTDAERARGLEGVSL